MKILAAGDMDIIKNYLKILNSMTGHTSEATGQYVSYGGKELVFQLPNSTGVKSIAYVSTKKDMIQLLIACMHVAENIK